MITNTNLICTLTKINTMKNFRDYTWAELDHLVVNKQDTEFILDRADTVVTLAGTPIDVGFEVPPIIYTQAAMNKAIGFTSTDTPAGKYQYFMLVVYNNNGKLFYNENDKDSYVVKLRWMRYNP